MTRVNLYAPFAGVKDGLTLCTLLLDKKKLEAVLGVVKELDDKITEINAAIEVYGKASKIDVLVRNAAQKDQEAGAALNEAVQQATNTKEEAKAWATIQREKVAQHETAVTKRESELSAAKAEFKTQSDAQQADLKARDAKVVENERKAEGLVAQHQKLKDRYEHALEALKVGVAAA